MPERTTDDFVTLPSGLQYHDVRVGDGQEVRSGDPVSVHYVGCLDDGSVFDDSRERGTPFAFELGRGEVIAGWDEGVAGMRIGGVRELRIPPHLAYADRGYPPLIPPAAWLRFEIELLALA